MEWCYKFFFFIIFSISMVASFSWQNCGSSSDPIKVTSLDIYSNQSSIIYLTGKGKVADNITEPITAKVEMQKKFFWGWTVIPCVDNVGSCIYNDLCELSPYKSTPCPPEFIANNLPCKCPILQGQYQAKKFPVDLNLLPHWIEKGHYRIQLTLQKSDLELICLLIYKTF